MRSDRTTFHRGMTLIELVFVIVILGIVSSIGAQIIAQVYESYILQRAQHRASVKTELALNQIANRLRYAIPSTVGARATKTGTFIHISQVTSSTNKALQWVAYDGDSFEAITSAADRKPGWSGFCDIDAYVSGSTSLPTPGSNLSLASEIITNLGGSIGNAMIYFPDNNTTSLGISGGSGESITLDTAVPSGSRIYERYKLAWSSYALVCENNTTDYPCGDLVLYYNFSPIIGSSIGGSSEKLLTRVSNFRFKGTDGSIRVKICKKEQIDNNSTTDIVTSCKEKVIF